MKPTREDDARVAEMIGKLQKEHDFILDLHSYFPKKCEFCGVYEDYKNEPCALRYTTAPTYETDGIVLDWVQDRGGMIFEMQFKNAVQEIITKRQDAPEIEIYYLNFFLKHYKPGDYARALLETDPQEDA